MTTYYLKTGGRCITQLAKMSIDPRFVEPTANDVVGKYSYKMRHSLIHVVENKPFTRSRRNPEQAAFHRT